MRNLKEDKEEVDSAKLKDWVWRKRHEYGIPKEDPACWFVAVSTDEETHTIWFGVSPDDALAYAEMEASSRMAGPRGMGRWILEKHGEGDGRNPDYLIVYPTWDPEQPVYD